MALIPPKGCDWAYTGCLEEVELPGEKINGESTYTQEIDMEYTLDEKVIESVKRNFTLNSKGMTVEAPDPTKYKIAPGLENPLVYCGDELKAKLLGASVNEKTTIVSSTLHYIDQRYKVYLIRKVTDTIKLEMYTYTTCGFKTTYGADMFYMFLIKEENYKEGTNRKEEWILYIDDAPTVISSITEPLHPFGPKNTVGTYVDGYASVSHDIDPEIRLILVHPRPPAQGDPQTTEILALGFYDYGDEGFGIPSELAMADGGKDYFYPEWCRNLSPNRWWRELADYKYSIEFEHTLPELDTNKYVKDKYTPPELQVDPIPVGSFVRHPQLLDFYQFLCGGTITGSPNIDNLIDRGTGTFLYYPISIA